MPRSSVQEPRSGPAGGLPLALRRFGAEDPARRETPDRWSDEKAGDPEILRCASCRFPITSGNHRCERNGAFGHTFLNPSGIAYEIGCFGRARGCAVVGFPTREFTWFPGFGWQIAICRSCQEHLGWAFTAPSQPGFFGLILERLVSDPPGPTH